MLGLFFFDFVSLLHPKISKRDDIIAIFKTRRICVPINIFERLYPKIVKVNMNKKQFRSYCLSRQKKITPLRRYAIDKRVTNRLKEHIFSSGARRVMLYIPLDNEVNIVLLIEMLRRKGIEVLVPFMEGSSFRLVRYKLPLGTKRFGVKEPKYSKNYKIKMIDIAVVPIVGVDASFRRVGFGQGMYDRFFSKNRCSIKQIVFVQRELCYCREIVTDGYDIGADLIITG